MNITADATGSPAAADVEALFNACIKRTFTSEDVKQIQASCQKLSALCQVGSYLWNPQRKVFHDFRQRQAPDFFPSAVSDSSEDKEAKKKAKKEKKKEKKRAKELKKKAKKQKKKEQKKAKKEKKKAKKGKKKHMSKKDRKKAKKEQKKAKKHKKKEKKEKKQEKKEKKKEEKKAKKQAEAAIPKEERKRLKREQEEAKKKAKKEKKEKKKEKKRAKEEKKVFKKFGSASSKLEKKEKELAKKLLKFVERQGKHAAAGQLSSSQIEAKLDEIKATLQVRERSISRFAPCLLFTKDSGKDALDSQCAILKKAAELTLQAEECWAGYLSVVSQCKLDAKKKKHKHCYETFATANNRCGGLASRGKEELKKLLAKEQPELKKL